MIRFNSQESLGNDRNQALERSFPRMFLLNQCSLEIANNMKNSLIEQQNFSGFRRFSHISGKNTCLKIFESPMSYEDAQSQCLNYNANLPVLRSSAVISSKFQAISMKK